MTQVLDDEVKFLEGQIAAQRIFYDGLAAPRSNVVNIIYFHDMAPFQLISGDVKHTITREEEYYNVSTNMVGKELSIFGQNGRSIINVDLSILNEGERLIIWRYDFPNQFMKYESRRVVESLTWSIAASVVKSPIKQNFIAHLSNFLEKL